MPQSTPDTGLRQPAQLPPTSTYIICIAADKNNIGGYNVESAGSLKGNATDQDIIKQINSNERSQLPARKNPFDLSIKAATKIVFHLEEDTWIFTDTQFLLTKGSKNETPNSNPGKGPHFEFGSLGWVTGGAKEKTISLVDTHRRKQTFEYGLFLSIQQGTMETTIEIDPRITNN